MSGLIEGVAIKIGAKEFVVPALSFKQLRQLMPKIKGMAVVGAEMTDQQMGEVVEVVHAAVSRNYPELNKEYLDENIDMNNVRQIIAAIMGQSGLVKTSGEATAGNP